MTVPLRSFSYRVSLNVSDVDSEDITFKNYQKNKHMAYTPLRRPPRGPVRRQRGRRRTHRMVCSVVVDVVCRQRRSLLVIGSGLGCSSEKIPKLTSRYLQKLQRFEMITCSRSFFYSNKKNASCYHQREAGSIGKLLLSVDEHRSKLGPSLTASRQPTQFRYHTVILYPWQLVAGGAE
jgi:hypothetical protein